MKAYVTRIWQSNDPHFLPYLQAGAVIFANKKGTIILSITEFFNKRYGWIVSLTGSPDAKPDLITAALRWAEGECLTGLLCLTDTPTTIQDYKDKGFLATPLAIILSLSELPPAQEEVQEEEPEALAEPEQPLNLSAK